jgi:hypothetical protein
MDFLFTVSYNKTNYNCIRQILFRIFQEKQLYAGNKNRPTGERKVYETSTYMAADKLVDKSSTIFQKIKKRIAAQLLPSFPTRFPRFPGIPEFPDF